MVALVMEKVPTSLRGELTRWTLELKAGVFVGTVSAVVRDLLWDKVKWSLKGGGAIMIHTDNSEQGFAIRYWGETSRRIEDFEGLWLVGVEENQGQF
jgi:CRISPR-associated protein Cas2